ncbi:MAG: hypothetical protein SFW08_07890 [Gemmatimonadaceae bacterium]|nr:hypothetical protein [Gemmatimonadaceae bacterium]
MHLAAMRHVVGTTVLAILLPMASGAAQEVAELTARTDSLLAQAKLTDARTAIEQARRVAPKDFEVLWRLARVWNLLGDEAGDKAGETFYLQSKNFAEQAVQANPKAAAGYVRRAAAGGKIALFRGALEAADLVRAVRDDAAKAIQLGDGGAGQQATAHYILGRTHLKLLETPRPLRMPVGLGWATLGDALTNLRRAVELRPDFVMFRLDYARALVRDGKTADARAQLEAGAKLSVSEVGDDGRLQEIDALLKELRGKS